MGASVVYGDISPRTAAFVVKDLLKRGMPFLVFEKFGQAKPLPLKSTKSMKWRRYFLKTASTSAFTPYAYFQTDADDNFDSTTLTLTEGTTPDAQDLEKEDYTATLTQKGGLITISDIVMDTHEDNVLQEAIEILGEQAAITIEKERYATLIGGSNVVYTNGSARTAVNTVFSIKAQRSAVRTLKRQLARPITSIVKSTPSYGTKAIAPAYVGVCHPDMVPDLRALSGWVDAENYGSVTPMEGEIGKCEEVRYIVSTVCEPIAKGGATGGTSVLETDDSGTLKADVYPTLIFGRDAYAIVPLKGKNSLTPMVVNPTPSDSDPLAQRGSVGWKAMTTCKILNDFWMVRVESACTDLD